MKNSIIMVKNVWHYITQIVTSPPAVIWRKTEQKVSRWTRNRLHRFQLLFTPNAISDDALMESLDDRFKTQQSLPDLWINLREAHRQLLLSTDEYLICKIRTFYADKESFTVRSANSTCNHIFDLLGSGPTYLGEKIDWHIDFKTGHRFNPRQYYADIRPAPYPGGYDIKVPWELSRCQHFAWLGQAYWLADDEKYAQEFVDQVEDWIASNPWPWGVNWTCTMDVAIRAVNWLWGYHFFLQSSSLSERFLLSFYKSLLQHGRHIYRNLENQGDSTGNHYLSNIVGLIYLGILCPEFKEASVWREYGLSELEKEMFKQVYPDGVNFEASTSYHRLVLEMFLSATILAQRNGHHFSSDYMERLEKMVEVIMYLTKPDGTCPLIGDNDNGRLHRLKVWGTSDREWVDFRYLLAIGAVMFKRRDFAARSGDQWEEAIWLFGGEVMDVKASVDKQTSFELQDLPTKAFLDAGLYIMRHGDNYLVVDAGSNGRNGQGGHAHNDVFSFELYADGCTWIKDPGAYIYTQDYEARNFFRSTPFHSTVTVDDCEQNSFNSWECFRISEQASPVILDWKCTSEYIWLLGQHGGYQRLSYPVQHRRGFLFDKATSIVIVIDFIYPTHSHLCKTYLHLAPGVSGSKSGQGIVLNFAQNKQITVHLNYSQLATMKVLDGFSSYGYGTKSSTKRICWQWSGDEYNSFVLDFGKEPARPSDIGLVYDRLHDLLDVYGVRRKYG